MRRSSGIFLTVLALAAISILSWRALFPKPPVKTANGSVTNPLNGQIGTTDAQRSVSTLPKRANPLASENSLQHWQAKLQSMPQAEAVKAIQDFLRTGQDAPTRQAFAIAADGHLASAPTLRTFLLDELGKRDLAAAAQIAEQILKASSSADEWALAMKYYALGSENPEKKTFLQDKMAALLRNESWQQNPSVGYLESFDVAVWLGGTKLTPTLCELARKKDNQAVAHAGYLALDRLVQTDPVSNLGLLQEQPSLMEGREQTRADYFARADVSDPQQRAILEKYLLNPALSGTELQKFAGLFPNANYMISYNLLTSVKTPDGATLSQKDARALQVLEGWLVDERFAKLRPQLEAMRTRLRNFVK
jgi:hypothetical protein